VVKAFSDALGCDVQVDECGHLMGAIGAALLAQRSGLRGAFDFAVKAEDFETRGLDCGGCANQCELIMALRDRRAVDVWGNRCERGPDRARASIAQSPAS
jgi:hypothetical protein